jgi:hypothetical protein
MHPVAIVLHIKELIDYHPGQKALWNQIIQDTLDKGELAIHSDHPREDYYYNTVQWALYLKNLDIFFFLHRATDPQMAWKSINDYSQYLVEVLRDKGRNVTQDECLEGIRLYLISDLHQKLITSATLSLKVNSYSNDEDKMDICNAHEQKTEGQNNSPVTESPPENIPQNNATVVVLSPVTQNVGLRLRRTNR